LLIVGSTPFVFFFFRAIDGYVPLPHVRHAPLHPPRVWHPVQRSSSMALSFYNFSMFPAISYSGQILLLSPWFSNLFADQNCAYVAGVANRRFVSDTFDMRCPSVSGNYWDIKGQD
jgi:hypothetical protein